jgi:hypothetical protein
MRQIRSCAPDKTGRLGAEAAGAHRVTCRTRALRLSR